MPLSSAKILSAAAARRIALAAQGFGRPRPARPPSVSQIAGLVDRLGVLQLDSVNVFRRAHYLPVFSRLGPYDRARARPDRRPRRRQARPPAVRVLGARGVADPGRAAPAVALADGRRRRRGLGLDLADRSRAARAGRRDARAGRASRARSAPATPAPCARRARPGHMWNWHEGKVALEYLFFTGRVAAARRVNFERLYDLPERVLPPEILAGRRRRRPTRSASWCGSPRGRWAWPPSPTSATTSGCRGRTRRRASPSWSTAASCSRSRSRAGRRRRTCGPRPAAPQARGARALLSPFDSLIWFRERTERLFGFRYRIEIYTPARQARATATTCCRSCSATRWSRGSTSSPTGSAARCSSRARSPSRRRPRSVAGELAAELRLVGGWLGLDGVEVAPRGDLSGALAAAVRPSREFNGLLRFSAKRVRVP